MNWIIDNCTVQIQREDYALDMLTWIWEQIFLNIQRLWFIKYIAFILN